MSRIKPFVTIVFFLFFGKVVAQQQNMLPLVQSPNTASLGTFGNVQLSPFTGLANVSIDVFSLKQGDIPVTCHLTYNTGGIKAAAHPGWVGLNWSLAVGGVITRKVNGGVDEVCNPYVSTTDPSFLAYSLLAHPTVLNNANWSSTSFITSYWGASNNNVYSPIVNPAPDEFTFTLPTGVAGSFYLNHLGNWVVKSKSTTNVAITSVTPGPVTINYDDNSGNTLTVERAIQQITIADDKGYVYTFGSTTTDRPIEFVRTPRPSGWPFPYNYNSDVIATAWHLTKITSPSGNVVNFSYTRPANQYVQGVQYPNYTATNFTGELNMGGWYGFTQTQATYSGQIITPSYLSTITCNAFTVNFNIAQTTEATYPYTQSGWGSTTSNNPWWNYSDLDISDVVNPASSLNTYSKWYQLNTIAVNDNAGTQQEGFTFYYSSSTSQRLTLNQFSRNNIGGSGDMNYYFTYNATPLPAYNAMKQDQWGYYNGQQFPSTVSNNPVSTSLLNYLSMSAGYAEAGLLTSIKYPTGGTTSFVYEPNDFSYVLQKNSGAINLVSQAGTGGGVRVHSITDNDNNGNSYAKTYSYTNQSTGASSGVLSGYNKIIYNVQIGQGTGANVSTMIYDDFTARLNYTDGRDVVYSEVKEMLPDGSSNIYDYSNSDNPTYIDEPPLPVYSNAFEYSTYNGLYIGSYYQSLTSTNSNPFMSHCSHELERGLLLKLTSKNAGGTTVKVVQNTYNSDPNRLNNYVRSFDNYSNAGVIGPYEAVEQYFQPIKLYTFYPYLANTTTTTYDVNGANPVAVTKTFTYDPTYRCQTLQTFTSSENEAVATTVNYANNPISGLSTSAAAAQTAMAAAGMSGIPLERTVTRNSNQTEHTRMDYQVLSNPVLGTSNILPAAYNEAFSTNALETRRLYSKFDNYGNLLEQEKPNDLPTAYIYDYKNNYLIAEVTNASAVDVAYTSFEADGKGNWSFAGATTADNSSPTGNNCYSLSGGAVTATGLNINTTYTVTYWIKGSSALSIAGTISGYPIQTATTKDGLWTCFTHKVTGQSTITVGGSGYIDELRLFPTGSLMKTYTYVPLIGSSSQCDANNHINYFQYDGLGRLHLALDQDKYVIKRIDYAYEAEVYYNRGLIVNDAKSCATGYQGSSVPYTVPAGKYSSTVSQAAADALAQNDANANAQNNANTYGVCDPGVTGYNSLSVGFTVTVTGGGKTYTFIIPAVHTPSSIIGYIPPGTYTAQACPNGTFTSQYVFQFGNNGLVQGTGCQNIGSQTVVNYGDAAIYLSPVGQAP